ncbi:glycosyltransferase [Campylobacter sp. VBCF_06 NA8]|uniref:glycosyltransferase n=1 Tax=Campylobacter sp. VBCF_06 NA8 TaxID=2983822 RepID=UPI0022E9A4E5|nr:glycosyltransferase [Campylobacter sp. VBCF_06 NA8]MDA3046289.1 glycosyltransferase [Campylobacter sp. VBCF_06 NA8]
MKIAYFSCSTIYGGVEKIVCDSVNELCQNDEVLLIVPNGCLYKDKISPKVRIYEYKNYDKRWNLLLYFEILKVLKKFGVQILHTHGAKASQMGFLLNKFMDFVQVATKHNVRKGKIFNKISNVISVSKRVAQTINHKSEVIYFGIKQRQISRNLGDKFSIIAVGRLDFIKGFDELIKSVSKLDFDFVLQIVGEGKERKNLQNLINSLNLQSKVVLLGFKDDVAQRLANSHLQIISSRSEGLSISLIEGIFYANVLLGTKVGGISEILDEEFFIDYENMSAKISKIYKNYDMYLQKFSEKHKEIKNSLKFENYISTLKNYYENCLK